MRDKFKKYLRTLFLPMALLIAGLYFVPLKILQPNLTKIPGDLADARFNNYILEHGYLFATGKVDKYWDASFMYPIKNVIAFSDNLIGTVPIYSAFRLLGMDRETAFQFWILALFILNFLCCWWVLRKWSAHPILAATGAYVFSFSIFILGNINHAQNFPRFMIPLVFYWTWKYLTAKDHKYFLFLFLGLVYQFYCGIYLGFFLLYCLLFFFLAYLIIYRDGKLFTQFKSLKKIIFHLLILVGATLLLAPLMLPYMEMSKLFGMRKFKDIVETIPTLRSYFFTTKAPFLWHSLSEHGMGVFPQWWNQLLFMGIMPWIGVVFVPFILFFRKVEAEKRKLIGFLFLGLFLSFVFCLKINEFTLYEYIFELPGFSSMRSINRVLNSEIMFFILIFVFVFTELSKISRYVKWMVYAFPVFIILDNLIDPTEVIRFDKSESQQQIQVVKKNIQRQYKKQYSGIAYFSYQNYKPEDNIIMEIARTQLNVMFAAQELNIPCVNGYTGSYPDEYLPFLNNGNNWGLEIWLNYSHFDKNKIQSIYDFDNLKKSPESIQLKAQNNKFVRADELKGTQLIADKDTGSSASTLTLFSFEKNKCALGYRTDNFICVELFDQNKITATRRSIDQWETFTIKYLDDNLVAFLACNGKYMSLDEKTGLIFASADVIGENEKFRMIGLK